MFETIFINSHGRLRSGWRFVIFGVLFILLSSILFVPWSIIAGVLNFAPNNAFGVSVNFVVTSTILLAAAVAAGGLCGALIENLPITALGWSWRGNWHRDLLGGALFGIGSLLLTALIAAFGGLSLKFNSAAGAGAIGQTIVISAIVFAVAAAAEEALFRGYALQTFTRARLIWVGAIVTSLLFAFVHSDNNSVTFFGLLNTLLAGFWFVAAYLKTRNLWFPFGMHWAWNWTMGAILGIPVSGISSIVPEPLFRQISAGQTWLTGGDYGLEGGAACTAALIISTLLIWRAPFLKPTSEMMTLTSQENPIQKSNLSLTDNVGDFER